MEEYKYYIQREVEGNLPEEAISIEDYFTGCKYLSFDGLSNRGAPKNIVIETYADADEPRVYIPEKIRYDTYDATLQLYFTGENRRDVYDQFIDYVIGRKITYWDTCRNRKLKLIYNSSTTTKEDVLKGGLHYIIAEFKFTNLTGTNEKTN